MFLKYEPLKLDFFLPFDTAIWENTNSAVMRHCLLQMLQPCPMKRDKF